MKAGAHAGIGREMPPGKKGAGPWISLRVTRTPRPSGTPSDRAAAGGQGAVGAQLPALALARAGSATQARLDLFANPDLHLRNVDPDGRGMILSCGATLHHCVVALAALGCRCTVQRLPDPANPDHLASIELCRPGSAEDELEQAPNR